MYNMSWISRAKVEIWTVSVAMCSMSLSLRSVVSDSCHSKGCYMDNKFYVIIEQNERGVDLTYGEFYDANRNAWELVLDMLKDAPVSTLRSPPLVTVVNNELYSLKAS
uniref:Uncharacterized protein n=1 Tax=Nelumbo nucifera TaxID=4432 RepID=A0A822ZX46_NELNU|nr:TPA_asm: hypothetical protein HUJ06_019007 [Nelumbo nucifera]